MSKQILRIPDGHIKPFFRIRHAAVLAHFPPSGTAGRILLYKAITCRALPVSLLT